MPANGTHSWVHYWAGRMPGSMGRIFSPGSQRAPLPWLPWALDNGAFTGFDEAMWRELLRWSVGKLPRPLWAACPDAVGDCGTTKKLWTQYHAEICTLGVTPAFVVQDGAEAADVPATATVVFVGGSTGWKESTLQYWCDRFPRVHVGRVNGYRMLRRCADAGAESCDGTGWGRGDPRQLDGLFKFLEEQEAGRETETDDGAMGQAGVRCGSLSQGNVSVRASMLQDARPQIHGHANRQIKFDF